MRDVHECFDEARDLVGGTQHPDAMADKHDLIDCIEKEVTGELRALLAVEKAAIAMLAVCPADDDATQRYWEAVVAFKAAIDRLEKHRELAATKTKAAILQFEI